MRSGFLVLASGLLTAVLLAAGCGRASGPPASTIGVNELVMGAEPATYRLRLDGSQLLLAVPGGSLLVDPRTGTSRAVIPSAELGAPGAWSHGRRAFATIGSDSDHRQVVVVVEGGLTRVVRSLLWGSRFAWAPRAQLLAVSDDKAVRVIDGRTGKDVAVIPVHTPYGLVVESISWSRDGRSVLLVASTHAGHD